MEPLLLVIPLDVHARERSTSVRLVVDPARVLAARDFGSGLRDFTPPEKTFGLAADERAHVDLDQRAKNRGRGLNAGQYLHAGQHQRDPLEGYVEKAEDPDPCRWPGRLGLAAISFDLIEQTAEERMEHSVAPRWRKSTYSGTDGNSCIELGQAAHGVLVRDTTNRNGTVLTIPAPSWQALLAHVKESR
jgi:hypothetical protein